MQQLNKTWDAHRLAKKKKNNQKIPAEPIIKKASCCGSVHFARRKHC